MREVADAVFIGATVYGIDDEWSTYEGMALANGRILALGPSRELLQLADEHTEVHDLSGGVVLPGFIEAHGHPTSEMNFIGPNVLDIRAVTTGSADVVMRTLTEAIHAAEESTDTDVWVTAFGWDPLLLRDLPQISGAFLTALSPRIPISVMHYSAHKSWTNQAGLHRFGLSAATPDPGASRFIRHGDGQLTGEALEIPATMMLMGPRMVATDATFPEFLQHTLNRAARAGVTMTGDLAFDPDSYPPMLAYQRERVAPVRIRAYERTGARAKIPAPGEQDLSGVDPLRFRPVGVKMWVDGSPWVGNIDTSFGYEDSWATGAVGVCPGHQGASNYTAAQLESICREQMSQGWQVACHVHGDRAVDLILDVIERVLIDVPDSYTRPRLEHCGSITPDQIRRAHALGVSISFFVAHIQYYGDILFELFGERADAWTPAGVSAEVGMRFSFHNDPPVTPESPLKNIETAMLRRAPSGRVMGECYRVGIREAIRAQTIYAAWQLHSETEVGSLEVGKLADFVVLSDDPTQVSPASVGSIEVLETWCDGRQTFSHVATTDMPLHRGATQEP